VEEGRTVAAARDAARSRDGEVERQWLAMLQQLTSGVAHELRNALNGVAVNLEVVRSRAGREGLAASALGSFAGSASDQLEQVIAMTDALMALARAGQEPAVIGRTTDQVAALMRPVLAANGGALDLAVEGEGTTRVPAAAARLFIAATLQAAVKAVRADGDAAKDSGASLTCRVRESAGEGEAKGVELRVEGAFARTPALDATLATLASEYGVGVRPAESSITSTFPA
jgi:signal transduction histidine kinase